MGRLLLFPKSGFHGFLRIPRILTELWCERFEWFDPSPIEPFNLGPSRREAPLEEAGVRPAGRTAGTQRRLSRREAARPVEEEWLR